MKNILTIKTLKALRNNVSRYIKENEGKLTDRAYAGFFEIATTGRRKNIMKMYNELLFSFDKSNQKLSKKSINALIKIRDIEIENQKKQLKEEENIFLNNSFNFDDNKKREINIIQNITKFKKTAEAVDIIPVISMMDVEKFKLATK